MANEPPNPYAPTDALAHDLPAAEKDANAPASGWPSRIGALVIGYLAFPLFGAGLAVLGRSRRLVVWVAIGVALWLLAVIGVRVPVPKLALFGLGAMVVVFLASLADTALAKRAQPRTRAMGWVLAGALVLAGKGTGLASRWFLMEAFQMPSGSMIPTLQVGDHIFIKKGHGGIGRGDVVVFKFPPDPSVDYIKRVIAIGGDTVEVRGGVVSVNGAPLEQQPIDGPCTLPSDDAAPGAGDCKLFRETNAGHVYSIVRAPDSPAMDQPETRVPPGAYFVVGDNRDNSYDSCRWGPVREDLIKGKATLIWWSKGPVDIRWSRIGHAIE